MLPQNVSVQVVAELECLIALQARNPRRCPWLAFVHFRHMTRQKLLRRCHEVALRALHAGGEMRANVIREDRSAESAVTANVAEEVFDLLVNDFNVLSHVRLELAANRANFTEREKNRK